MVVRRVVVDHVLFVVGDLEASRLPGVLHALAAPLVREPFGLADSHAA